MEGTDFLGYPEETVIPGNIFTVITLVFLLFLRFLESRTERRKGRPSDTVLFCL